MTYAPFRTSHKFYFERPPSECVAARHAWDRLAATGPLVSMRLIEGLWMCERPDGSMNDVESTMDNTRTALRREKLRGV